MKSMKFMALLLSMAFVLSHAKNEDSKYWENEQINYINVLPARVITYSYPNIKQALERNVPSTVKSLNGEWRFMYSEKPELRPANFYLSLTGNLFKSHVIGKGQGMDNLFIQIQPIRLTLTLRISLIKSTITM